MEKRFCPKCNSENIKIGINASAALGAPQVWECNECKFQNYLFPIKEKLKVGVKN